MLQGLPDLFAEFFDLVDRKAFRSNVCKWSQNGVLDSISRSVAGDIVSGESGAEPQKLRLRAHNGTDPQASLFAVMRGMDAAFAHVNPYFWGDPCPAPLKPLELEVAARGRLDSGAQGGAVLPRLVEQGAGHAPDALRDAFHHVIRVPAVSWDACVYEPLPGPLMFTRADIQAGLTIACCPLIEDPDEMLFEQLERDEGRFYRIGPADAAATHARIPEVVARLDASGAVVGLMPESTLTPALLAAWQTALRSPSRGPSTLRWIVAGSGNLGSGPRPSNTAVILDARTGAVAGTQAKVFGFNMQPKELELWQLESRLGTESVDEDLEPGSGLTIFDAGGVRLALLICEDLGRIADHGPVLRDFGVSHVFAPVFGRPLQERRWERGAAENYVRDTGTTVVVSNSRVMQSILGKAGSTALVVNAEGALALEAPDAASLATFVLNRDGSATAV